MCYADPAVLHAVNVLSAAYRKSEMNNMQMAEHAVQDHQLYRTSIQQLARAVEPTAINEVEGFGANTGAPAPAAVLSAVCDGGCASPAVRERVNASSLW
ncbi:hypothetical protein BJY00DRAFT_274213 [Aspergillus carlsbadensis]|nr:hypothetical protein BJY00DRAFT_274213 [Aspergillus carlsbadensis]